MITQEDARYYFDYNPSTGEFRWKNPTSRTMKAGHPAGGLDDRGVLRIKLKGVLYKAHRLAWLYVYGVMPPKNLDMTHKNDDLADNRISNLALKTRQQTAKSWKRIKRNRSGVMGVQWNSRDKAWYSRMKHNQKDIHLGYFNDYFEAVCARKSAENRYGYRAAA